jgi:cytochrome P450
MSSRVFLGEEICRDKRWLDIMTNYSVILIDSIQKLTKYPVAIRRYIAWLFPECGRVYDQWLQARDLIVPVVKKREEAKRAAVAAGQPEPRFNDALDWIEEESRAKGTAADIATFQLILSIVAINTSIDLTQNVLVDLIKHPDALQAVREEMVKVLKAEGWKKTSLYNMKLLDSVIKESQRLKPLFSGE